MTLRAKLSLCAVLFLTTTFAVAQDGVSTVIAEYNSQQYAQVCQTLHRMSSESDGFKRMSPAERSEAKASGLSWLHVGEKGTKADQSRYDAEACADYYMAGLLAAADDDWMIAGDDVELGGRKFADVQRSARRANPPAARASHERGTQAVPQQNATTAGQCPSDQAMQKNSRLVQPCVNLLVAQARREKAAGQLAQAKATYERVRQVNSYLGFLKDVTITNEATNAIAEIDNAQHPQPQAKINSTGSGSIPDGAYECYSASTATFVGGRGAVLNPGQWHGRIHIRGNGYQLEGGTPGHYKVGANGKIQWLDGGYAGGDTLGRYGVVNGTPTIAINWAGTDAGLACTRR